MGLLSAILRNLFDPSLKSFSRTHRGLRRWRSCATFALVRWLAVFGIVCVPQVVAQPQSADWIGGAGAWSDKTNWSCNPGDQHGNCVPSGNAFVSIANGGSAVLDIGTSAAFLFSKTEVV